MQRALSRVSYVFLCVAPLLIFPLAAIRALRVPGIYQTIGGIAFAAVLIAAWALGARCLRSAPKATEAAAGTLLLAPTMLMALLWVGLGTPWDATPAENRMRYVVLLLSAIAVTSGFVMLSEALRQTGERFYSTLGFAPNLLAGASYLVWASFALSGLAVDPRTGHEQPAAVAISDVFDSLLFIACVLSYLATMAFAAAMGRLGWLNRATARWFVIVSFVLTILLMLRGVSYPDPTAGATPWWTRPGYIAGVPAVPWIIPFLLGVVLLRRAGDGSPKAH
jgi:hypothetical protein